MPQTVSSRVFNLKRKARTLAKAQGITLASALDIVAIVHGHANWSLLMAADKSAEASCRTQDSPAAAAGDTGSARLSESGLGFGFALFDEPSSPQAGWACHAGEQPVRIADAVGLDTATLWWTNITYEAFFRTTGVYRNPWLRHDAYVVVKPRDVMLEWGIDPETADAADACRHCADAFGWIMDTASALGRECGYSDRRLFSNNTMRADLLQLLPAVDYPQGEAQDVLAPGVGHALFTRTLAKGCKDGRMVMLRRPRLAHAMEMLATPLPQGPFELWTGTRLSSVARDLVETPQALAAPFFADIALEGSRSGKAGLYGFGNATDRNHRIMRSWVAQPELGELRSLSAIAVRNAFVGTRCAAMDLPLPVRKVLLADHSARSWTCGVVAETLWRAVQTPGKPPGSVKGMQGNVMSWQGAWLSAVDKVSMFRTAVQLEDRGHPVMSYGYGWLFCQVTAADIPQLIADGFALGLLPRMQDVPEQTAGHDEDILWQGRAEDHAMARAIIGKDSLGLAALDVHPRRA